VRSRRGLAVVRALWETRDEIAREADLSPRRVLGDQAIIEAAKTMPASRPQLDAIGGFLARDIDVAFLVSLAFAIAAAANLPTIAYSLFWRGFTGRGALWSIYGGLISSIVLIIFSPVVSGSADPSSPSLITDPHVNFAYFPLDNPGIVSIPLAFFLGWLGSVTDPAPADNARFARIQVRALTGVGAERSSRG